MEAAGDEGGAVDEPRALAVPGHPALASSTIVLHKATDAFPLVHEFIGTERYARMPTYTRDRMRVRMDDFVEFLSKAAQVLLFTHTIIVLDGLNLLESVTTNSVVAQVQSRVLRVLRTKLLLRPLDKYVDVSSAQRYRYATGLWNIMLSADGLELPIGTKLLRVKRACACGAVCWTEMLDTADARDRMLQIQFTQFSDEHKPGCQIAAVDQNQKPTQLTPSQRAAVKELSRVTTTKPSTVEKGEVVLNSWAHDPRVASIIAEQAKGLPIRAIRHTMKNARKAGKGGEQDFDVVHRLILAALGAAEGDGALDDFHILEYHPAEDPSCKDVKNPRSHYWIVVQMPHANRDLAQHGKVCIAFDGKQKLILDHGIVVLPICTLKPGLPRMPGSKTLAHGLRLQHSTQLNQIMLANTEAAGVITGGLSTIKGCLTCDDPACEHKVEVERFQTGGFRLSRPRCSNHPRPGMWNLESYDLCAAYLRSTVSTTTTSASLHSRG